MDKADFFGLFSQEGGEGRRQLGNWRCDLVWRAALLRLLESQEADLEELGAIAMVACSMARQRMEADDERLVVGGSGRMMAFVCVEGERDEGN